MLETLLKHFRSYGMEDLEFIIVNSKLSHSQEKLHELEKRVSFSVFQETDEEEVWSVMEGDKDDMFVYDRCGRLTYYVPFPLSILTETPLVSNAILATYFRSPCGQACDTNETLGIEEIAKNLQDDIENSTYTTEESANYTTIEEALTGNETSYYSANNLFDLIDTQNEFGIQNSTDFDNTTYLEHPVNNSSNHIHETNNSTVGKATEYFNALYRLFFNIGHNNHSHENSSTINVFNETENATAYNEQDIRTDVTNQTIHSHHKHNHKMSNKTEEVKETKKSNRCVEADYAVCKSWSKRRLLHAQKCCSEIHADDEVRDRKTCHNFGKRRCKKIQSILKCCIKTVYTEATEVPTTTEETTATETSDLVCCRKIGAEKECRVSNVGTCDEDEYVQGSSAKSK